MDGAARSGSAGLFDWISEGSGLRVAEELSMVSTGVIELALPSPTGLDPWPGLRALRHTACNAKLTGPEQPVRNSFVMVARTIMGGAAVLLPWRACFIQAIQVLEAMHPHWAAGNVFPPRHVTVG